MISHSIITFAYMMCAWIWYWALGLDAGLWTVFVLVWTAFILGWWYSREQYWEEYQLRRQGKDSIWYVLLTLVMVFRPMRRNMDLFAPVAVALVMATAFIMSMYY